MRWVHLSDLHVGAPNPLRQSALKSLVGAIREAASGTPIDAILLTGDIAYSGKASEYEDFHTSLLSPIRAIPECSGARVIAVPGNHDLDCEITTPSPWRTIGERRRADWFRNDEIGRRTRQSRASGFSAYREYLQRADIAGPLGEPSASATIAVPTSTGTVQIIGLVTAYFSDAQVSDREATPAPTESLRQELDRLSRTDTIVVLGHHPPAWFEPESEPPFVSALAEYNAIYLHGHEHRVMTQNSQSGLRTLGFGAAYQNRPYDSAKPFYRNSFAVCQLDDALHVRLLAWDQEVGRWHDDLSLPADFSETSSQLPSGYVLDLPKTSVKSQHLRRRAAASTTTLLERLVGGGLWIGPTDRDAWIELLARAGIIGRPADSSKTPRRSETPTDTRLVILTTQGWVQVVLNAARSHLVSSGEVESANTYMDTERLDQTRIVSMGGFDDQATRLADKLARSKDFQTFNAARLVRALLRSLPAGLRRVLEDLDPARVRVELVLSKQCIAAVAYERLQRKWFAVIDERGDVVPESDALVLTIRDIEPDTVDAAYGLDAVSDPDHLAELSTQPRFSATDYKEKSYAIFDQLRYEGLAAIGLPLDEARLRDVYVPATAETSDGGNSPEAEARLIEGYLDALGVDDAEERKYFEQKLRSALRSARQAEAGGARELYQQFKSILILGDPGSGKSCFVKNEMLAYCRPETDGSDWYRAHVPVYVSLAELARHADGELDMLRIVSELCARKGLELAKEELERQLRTGTIAFFFDGLDEVSDPALRLKVVSWVVDAIDQFGSIGNRFVITSRPAVFAAIETPRQLKVVHLLGLTDDQIRTLAAKVLNFDGNGATAGAPGVVDQFLDNCSRSTGLRRMSRNPLLLTLLVLIFKNTGIAHARRHKVYASAVQTLVSVRNRATTGRAPLSESDLRRRLGAVAVSILDGAISEVPTVSEVRDVLARAMAREVGISTTPADFVQAVAEATGLLRLHRGGESATESTVSFMHYSFLEYYAAAGLLLSESYLAEAPVLAYDPRWHESIVLMTGMIADTSSVTPIINGLLTEQTVADKLTGWRTLFALESAAECDVPPETTQVALARALDAAMRTGGGRVCGFVRRDIAVRLARFLGNTSSIHVVDVLVDGLQAIDSGISAAFVDLVGRLGFEYRLPDRLVVAFESATERKEHNVRAACATAVGRCRQLCTDRGTKGLAAALRGSAAARLAALRAISSNPAIGVRHFKRIVELVEPSVAGAFVAAEAAQCALRVIPMVQDNPDVTSIAERCILSLQSWGAANIEVEPVVGISPERAQIHCESQDLGKRILGIHMLACFREKYRELHEQAIAGFRDGPDDYRAACLTALAGSLRALELVTVAEAAEIRSVIRSRTTHRNVRLAAVDLTALLPLGDDAVAVLLEHLEKTRKGRGSRDEVQACIDALVGAAAARPDVAEHLFSYVSGRLPNLREKRFGDDRDQFFVARLLYACEVLGTTSNQELVKRVRSLATDYRVPKRVRQHAIRAYCAVTPVSTDLIEFVTKELGRGEGSKFDNEVVFGCERLVHGVSRSPEVVQAARVQLSKLRETLGSAWARQTVRRDMDTDEAVVRSIWTSVSKIDRLLGLFCGVRARNGHATARHG